MWTTTLNQTSKLTLELRDVIDGGVDIWDFEYPSYYTGEEKRAWQQKVIDHYYFRQIGQETVGRFLHMFRARIREIMPYYIEMYKSVEIMSRIEDPFGNIDITETFEQSTTDNATGSSSGSSTTSSSGESDNEHRFSNTPQGAIANLDSYMTEASRDHDEQSSSGSASAQNSSSEERSGSVRHTLTRKGNQGVNTYAHDMIEFRKSFINVDLMIIKELNDLFLGVY